MNKPIYHTLKVVFAEPIRALNEMFSDTQSWGVSTLKEWIDGYESTRFTPIDGHTAIITSEYNIMCQGMVGQEYSHLHTDRVMNNQRYML